MRVFLDTNILLELQAASAEACNAQWIVTRNTGDFGRSRVPAITPQDFLQRFVVPAAL